jgi:hypothetical protein
MVQGVGAIGPVPDCKHVYHVVEADGVFFNPCSLHTRLN